MRGVFEADECGVYNTFETFCFIQKYLPGFRLEFVDTNGVPYFSTCDGLELWHKEHYEWYAEVLRLNELINELHTKMMFSCKKDICRYENTMATIFKKLNDMGYDDIDMVVAFSKPISRLY